MNVIIGERIWEFHPIIDRLILESDLFTLPDHIVKLVQTHAEFYPGTSKFILAADGDFYMNHSDDPNLEDHGDFGLARKNIAIGDEITCDYRSTKVWSFPIDPLINVLAPASKSGMQAQK